MRKRKWKVSLMHNDMLGRFQIGEEGIAVKSDYDKYDYKVDLGDIEVNGKKVYRIFYFDKHELEFLES